MADGKQIVNKVASRLKEGNLVVSDKAISEILETDRQIFGQASEATIKGHKQKKQLDAGAEGKRMVEETFKEFGITR